jgi:hypothetical protein
MGADLGGQNTFGQILLDHILIEIGFQFFRLQVEFDLAEFGIFDPIVIVFFRFGNPMRSHHFNTAAIFVTEILTQFFFQFFRIRNLFHVSILLAGYISDVEIFFIKL